MKNPAVRALLIGTFFSRMAMFMSVPFLAIYLTSVLHFTTVRAGIIVGVNPLITVVASFFVGKLAEKVSAERLVRVIPIIWGLVYLSFYFSTTFWLFMVLNSLNGLCYAIYEPNAKRLLVDYAEAGQSLLIFNLRYAAINIGALFGPLLGNLFNIRGSLVSYLILGSVYFMIGVGNFFLFQPGPSLKTAKKSVEHSNKPTTKIFVFLLIGMGFSYFGYSQFQSATLSQYYANSELFQNGVARYSLFLFISQGMVILGQFVLLKVTKHVSSYKLLILSNLLLVASLLFVPYSANQPIWLVLIALYSLGELLIGAHFDQAVNSLATTNKTQLFSLTELMKLGSAAGPVVGSYLITFFGYQNGAAIFTCLAGITLIGSLFLAFSFHFKEKS